MNALLAETIDKKDVQAVIAVYRDLRKNDLGSGKYDFGETSLNILTENLLKQDKAKEAGAKAKADYQKILELNPRDEWAKKQLEQLSSKQ